MKHDDVVKAVDSGDTRTLKYIFANCLDGDPLFEKYKEDYKYCLEKNALFVTHKVLPADEEKDKVIDEKYWVQLKNDFMENPSKERFEHMIKVAPVIYRESIERIQKKRQQEAERQKAKEAQIRKEEESTSVTASQPEETSTVYKAGVSSSPKPAAIRRESVRSSYQPSVSSEGEDSSKKASGMGLTLIIAVLILIVLILIVKAVMN